MVTPLVKHKIVKKRTNRFNRYQSDRKVTVKVRECRVPGEAMQLGLQVNNAVTRECRGAAAIGRGGRREAAPGGDSRPGGITWRVDVVRWRGGGGRGRGGLKPRASGGSVLRE